MPHRKGMEMAGVPGTEGLHHTHVDHNPHHEVPGTDRRSEEKIETMYRGRK